MDSAGLHCWRLPCPALHGGSSCAATGTSASAQVEQPLCMTQPELTVPSWCAVVPKDGSLTLSWPQGKTHGVCAAWHSVCLYIHADVVRTYLDADICQAGCRQDQDVLPRSAVLSAVQVFGGCHRILALLSRFNPSLPTRCRRCRHRTAEASQSCAPTTRSSTTPALVRDLWQPWVLCCILGTRHACTLKSLRLVVLCTW